MKALEVSVWDDKTDEIVTMYQEPEGDIMCKSCKVNWCKHIEMVVIKDADGVLLWSVLPAGTHPYQDNTYRFKIPCMPTKSLWALVQLEPINPNLYRVYMEEPEGVARTDDVSENGMCYIGILNRNEGRRILRLMAYEYFRGHYDEKFKCHSRNHTVEAQLSWGQRMAKGGQEKEGEHWSVFITGFCLFCNSQTASYISNWDEDVPKDTRPARRF